MQKRRCIIQLLLLLLVGIDTHTQMQLVFKRPILVDVVAPLWPSPLHCMCICVYGGGHFERHRHFKKMDEIIPAVVTERAYFVRVAVRPAILAHLVDVFVRLGRRSIPLITTSIHRRYRILSGALSSRLRRA